MTKSRYSQFQVQFHPHIQMKALPFTSAKMGFLSMQAKQKQTTGEITRLVGTSTQRVHTILEQLGAATQITLVQTAKH
jgi:hypothetical protein